MIENRNLLIDTPIGKRTWRDISMGLRWLDSMREMHEKEFQRRSEIAKKAWAKRKQIQQGESK